jgi:hypothetical protein
MKKYLFGLGAMIVGAGLMFGFTHTEVSAEDTKDASCTKHKISFVMGFVEYCKIEDLTCVVAGQGISCVKE